MLPDDELNEFVLNPGTLEESTREFPPRERDNVMLVDM